MNPDGWPLDDVIDACEFLEATGRTLPKDKWVEEIAARSDAASFRSLM